MCKKDKICLKKSLLHILGNNACTLNIKIILVWFLLNAMRQMNRQTYKCMHACMPIHTYVHITSYMSARVDNEDKKNDVYMGCDINGSKWCPEDKYISGRKFLLGKHHFLYRLSIWKRKNGAEKMMR